MASLAHAGTSTSIPGSVIFDEGQAIIPTPKLESRWRTKQYEKDQERYCSKGVGKILIITDDTSPLSRVPVDLYQLKMYPKTSSRCQEPADDKEIDIDVMAGRTKRELVEMKALKQISTWLRFHNFREMDVNEQQVPSGCFLFKRPEPMCPIHVAAKRGHERIIKFLLMARADPTLKTSRGRTALEIARKADVKSSHRETMEALETAERAVSVRRAIQIMGN